MSINIQSTHPLFGHSEINTARLSQKINLDRITPRTKKSFANCFKKAQEAGLPYYILGVSSNGKVFNPNPRMNFENVHIIAIQCFELRGTKPVNIPFKKAAAFYIPKEFLDRFGGHLISALSCENMDKCQRKKNLKAIILDFKESVSQIKKTLELLDSVAIQDAANTRMFPSVCLLISSPLQETTQSFKNAADEMLQEIKKWEFAENTL